jgi:hypothetical protein
MDWLGFLDTDDVQAAETSPVTNCCVVNRYDDEEKEGGWTFTSRCS